MVSKCDNWSIENKQCKFNYTPHPYIPDKDLNPLCNGEVGKAGCSWYLMGALDLAGNDTLRTYLRKRMRQQNART